MRRRGLVAALLGAALPGCPAVAEPAPLVAVFRIGMTVPDLAAELPGLVHPEEMTDDAPVTVTVPTVPTIEAGPARLMLPATRFVMVSQAAGIVYGVDTSPMLEFGGLAACHGLALELADAIGAGGWTVTERYRPSVPEMRAALAEPDRLRFEQTYATFHAGSATLRLYMREARGAGLEGMSPPARGNLFLVNVDVVDEVLHGTLMARMFAKRQASGVGVNSLPLAAWLSDRR